MPIYIAVDNCSTTNPETGMLVRLRKGQAFPADHPLVRLRPGLFVPMDTGDEIEQTTRRPGEKRTVRRG